MNAREFEALKEKVDNAQQKVDRAKGSREVILKRLEKEFSISSLEHGEREWAKLDKEAAKEETEYEREKKKWEETYGERI